MITFKEIQNRDKTFTVQVVKGRRILGKIIKSNGCYLYSDFGYGEFKAQDLADITHKCCEINRKIRGTYRAA